VNPDENKNLETEIRDQQEIALRALGLYVVWCIAHNYDERKRYVTWIDNNKFEGLFSKDEVAFMAADPAPMQQIINISWHCERLIILLWCLGLIDGLPAADTQCETSIFLELIPPLNENFIVDFLSKVELRSEEDLWALEETITQQHWKLRNAKIKNQTIDEPIDIEIVQERHHAINWVLRYCRLGWDDMVCDT
jgi:hypothetical protein